MLYERAIFVIVASGAIAGALAEVRADQKLEDRQHRIEDGRKKAEHVISQMTNSESLLAQEANRTSEHAKIADSIKKSFSAALSRDARQKLETDYKDKLAKIRNQDMTQQGAQETVQSLEFAARQDVAKLHRADDQDTRNLHDEVRSRRSKDRERVKRMAKEAHKAVHSMGSAYHLEKTEKKADYTEHEYDHDEDALEHGEDSLHDQVEQLANTMNRHIDDKFDAVQAQVDSDEVHHDELEQKLQIVRDAVMQKTNELQQSVQLSQQTQKANSASSPLFLAAQAPHHKSKADKHVEERRRKIEEGRKKFRDAIAKMEDHETFLAARSNNTKEHDAIALSIENNLKALDPKKRQALYYAYEEHLRKISQQDMTKPGAAKAVQDLKLQSRHDAERLNKADDRDKQDFKDEIRSRRHADVKKVKDLAAEAKKAIHSMGSATHLELAEEKADYKEQQYDGDETKLSSEEGGSRDRIRKTQNKMNRYIDETYDSVKRRVDLHAAELHHDTQAALQQRLQAVQQAAQSALSKSQSNSSKTAAVSAYQVLPDLDRICAASAVGAMAGVVAFVMQRRSGFKRNMIRQPLLLA